VGTGAAVTGGGGPVGVQPAGAPGDAYKLWQVILASSAGTAIEWYDFYLFGTLAALAGTLFFPPGNETAAFLLALATFGAGFAVRPFGAIVFGRVGDLIGRKYAFLLTLLIMGLGTTAIGLMPTYAQIGLLAPVLLVLLRLLQGLALGGEYGGAATYVAEHAPDQRRGYYTSFIQTTATVGFFASLLVVTVTRLVLGDAAFREWGWRIPFLLSGVLVVMSYYIRVRLRESPLFARLKSEGKSSTAPLKDSFGNRRNWRLILLALFGATAGQAVVWYTGQFYAQTFMTSVLKVDFVTANTVVAIALALGVPFFVAFGALSDRIGRKGIMMAGMLVAAVTYVPIYMAMDAFKGSPPVLVLLVFIQVLYVTMVYGPIAAYLVELFPAKIRYTSMSLPYHVGNGWFGGWLPFIATGIVFYATQTFPGHPLNIYAGLLYPIAVALMSFGIGTLFLWETKDVRIWDEVGGRPPLAAPTAGDAERPASLPAT
jgi:MFS family permease